MAVIMAAITIASMIIIFIAPFISAFPVAIISDSLGRVMRGCRMKSDWRSRVALVRI